MLAAMPEYDVASAEGAKEGLICAECDLILREAVQTASDVRLCLDCFENIKQTKTCRSEKTGISVLNDDGQPECCPDMAVRREVQQLTVTCKFRTVPMKVCQLHKEACCIQQQWRSIKVISRCFEYGYPFITERLELFERLIMRLLITRLINAKLVLLLVYSLATVVSLLRALRSGWGPPLELALSLSNDNYWQVFVDVFADLLACVWSNPDTTLYWILTISLILATLYTAQCYPCSVQYESSTAEVSKGCTPIAHRRDLHQSVAREGDWYYLCLSLSMDDTVTQPLYNSDVSERVKKRECLDAFYDLGEGEACWERVVRALAGPLIDNRRLAKDIAKVYGIDFEKTTNKSEL